MVLNARELLNPDHLDSVPFNVRLHEKIETIFRKIYAKFYPSKQRYTQGKLMGIAILLLNKHLNENNLKVDDDLIKQLGL
ncbi:MAG: hypothetical protein GY797_33585 [Deltaproteobacteria bacterium]|nr:hypothetical protein [Deltaproteobacteria bacterium]